jgi:hypothetical protein
MRELWYDTKVIAAREHDGIEIQASQIEYPIYNDELCVILFASANNESGTGVSGYSML